MRFPLIRNLRFVGRKEEPARDEGGRYVSANRIKVKAVAREMREAMGMDVPEVLR